MPMHYAKRFKADGYSVTYIVDVPPENKLSRPEHQFKEINFPYPEWIIDLRTGNHAVRALSPRLFFSKIIDAAKDHDVYFLTDFSISLAPYLPNNSIKILLPHGTDFDLWSLDSGPDKIATTGRFKKFSLLKKTLADAIKCNMQRGVRYSNCIVYYPQGFNNEADKQLEILSNEFNIETSIRRYDVSFDIFNDTPTTPKKNHSRPFKIISPVRFDFSNKNTALGIYNKGNDNIINGISIFLKNTNADIEIVFFNKGQDLELAKIISKNLGIDQYITWKDPVTLPELLEIYFESDVCFDQVGTHWIGAVGAYALYAGLPLIANASQFDRSPIFHASTAEEVCSQLETIYENFYQIELTNEFKTNSRDFAERTFSIKSTYNKLKDFIEKAESLGNNKHGNTN
ncbi:hypothetical protein EGI20_03880 [Aquitalea sp. S1-19]|nr:hypothetical protein [Aquitalea sp. S1-19]